MKKNRLTAFAVSIILMMGLASGAVISADNIEYGGNTEFFQGDVFTLYVSGSGSTDTIRAGFSERVSADTLSSGVQDGEVSQYLDIQSETLSYSAQYELRPSNGLESLDDLKAVTHTTDTSDQAKTWARNNCYDLNFDGSVSGDMVITNKPEVDLDDQDKWNDWEVHCMRNAGGTAFKPAVIENNPDRLFQTRFTVQAEGKATESGVISNSDVGDGRVVDLGDNVKVQWDGNKPTGQAVPEPTGIVAIHSNREGGWRTVSKTSYTGHFDTLESMRGDIEDWAQGSLAKSNVQNTFDSSYSQAKEPETNSPLAGAEPDGGYTDGVFTLELDKTPFYPTFIIYVKGADYLEVKKTAGQPEILDTSSTRAEEGNTGTVTAEVKNIGNAEGKFNARLTQCGGNFEPLGTGQANVEPGGITSFNLEYSFSTTEFDGQTAEDVCTVEVTDEASGEKVSAEADVSGKQALTCTPGSLYNKTESGNQTTAYVWGDNCQNVEKATTCEGDEYLTTDTKGEFICKEKGSPPGVEKPCQSSLFGTGIISYTDPICKTTNNITGGFSATTGDVARYFFAILAGVIGFGLGRNTLSDFAKITDDRTRTILGLVIGGFMAVLLFSLWANPVAWLVVLAGVLFYLGVGRYIKALYDFVSSD